MRKHLGLRQGNKVCGEKSGAPQSAAHPPGINEKRSRVRSQVPPGLRRLRLKDFKFEATLSYRHGKTPSQN